MKKSPVYPRYETSDYNGDEYNPHEDFSQFLEEAKQNDHTETDSLVSSEEEVLKSKQDQEKSNNNIKKTKKKPWKAFVSLPWWTRQKKKKKDGDEPRAGLPMSMSPYHASKRRSGFASGPVYGTGHDGRPTRRPLSGPLMSSLFSPIRKAGSDTPYVCLDRLDRPCADKNYGPVYLVT